MSAPSTGRSVGSGRKELGAWHQRPLTSGGNSFGATERLNQLTGRSILITYHQLKTGKVVKLWLNQLSIYGRIMVDITILYFYRWAYDWQGQYFGLCTAFESRLFFNRA